MAKNHKVEKLKSQITEVTNDFWEKNDGPILLSSLGGSRDGEIAALARELAVGLQDFISAHLPDKVVTFHDENNPIKIGAFPYSITTNPDFSAQSYFPKSKRYTNAAAPRYNFVVWAAFKKPLKLEMKRYISIEKPIKFLDVLSSETIENDLIKIDRNFICPESSPAAEIANSIVKWASENDVPESKLLLGGTNLNSGRTLLDNMINVLSDEELGRVVLPLDIIKKLNS